ncbi:hypothetical protein MUO79_09050 [Candidatus Bathyarchaeota archaeon]|nr:hypothetical protein [Candidatus Bathyarchaeota archaeon]
MESKTKKFHFQEIDWIVYFPSYGNEGKYRNYNVTFRDRKRKITQPGKRVKLCEVLDRPEIENNYPHTVGFYKESSGKGAKFRPYYLELRKIRAVEEFWMFLNALDI